MGASVELSTIRNMKVFVLLAAVCHFSHSAPQLLYGAYPYVHHAAAVVTGNSVPVAVGGYKAGLVTMVTSRDPSTRFPDLCPPSLFTNRRVTEPRVCPLALVPWSTPLSLATMARGQPSPNCSTPARLSQLLLEATRPRLETTVTSRELSMKSPPSSAPPLLTSRKTPTEAP